MCQTISGAYFVVVAQSLFANRMLETLRSDSPNIDSAMVLGTGANEIQGAFSGNDFIAVINAYMVGIKDVFAFSLACAAASVLVTLIIPFKRLPDHGKKASSEPSDESNQGDIVSTL